jgi:uncharacterized protein involved in exopolysaccharide biosynthesis
MSGSETTPRKPIKSQALGGYWRVPVFALAGALIAFTFSFVFKAQYPSASRLLIRTGETSYASTDSAASLGDNINIGGIDLTKQQTLGNTLVNLATSREAAAEIVERVGVDRVLDGEEPSQGLASKVTTFVKTGTTGAAPTKEEAAVNKVQGSLEVAVLDESWVMEITAWDPNPQLARLIADTAADVTVDQSSERFRENSLRELDYLTGELGRVREDVTKKAQAVAQFKSANGIIVDTSSDSIAGALTPTSAGNLDQLNNQLVGQRAREQVLREQLSSTPRTVTVSGTNLDGSPNRSQAPNPEYAALEQQLSALQADIAATEAQFNALATRLGGGTAPGVNEIQVQLSQLQNDLELAQENYNNLNERFSAVSATVEKPRFDASRLGEAEVPTTPGRPLRYLFLVVGGLVGALAGLLLTWFRIIREEDEQAGTDADHGAADGQGPVPPLRDDFIVDVRQPVSSEAVHGVLSRQDAAGLSDQLGVPPRPDSGATGV